jgi:hypothetical protein
VIFDKVTLICSIQCRKKNSMRKIYKSIFHHAKSPAQNRMANTQMAAGSPPQSAL